MDETDLSEDTTYKQQEDLPYDGDLSQMKTCNNYDFTSKNNILHVADQVTRTEDDPQEKAVRNETCRNAAMAMALEKITENTVNKECDKEEQDTTTFHIPANNGDTSKSNISDILLHHFSKEPFLRGQGIDCETFPETSNADSVDKAAIIKNIISHYAGNSWRKEQTSEFIEQLNPKWDGENSNTLSCFSSTTEENTSGLEEPMASSDSSHQEDSNFLTKIKGPSDKQRRCLGQVHQILLTEKANSSTKFKYGQGQMHYQFPDFSKVAPKEKIPKNNIINKPLTVAKQPSFSPKLRSKSTTVQDILETTSMSNCVEKQHPEQKRGIIETLQQIQMESTVHIHRDLFKGIESETNFLKLPSTSQKDPSSTSYIFQKISQGKQMCQKLKEQTDQLKTKVQEFSKRIKQDSLYHLQDRKLWIYYLPHQSPHNKSETMGLEKEVEGEIFKLEMVLGDIKEKIDENKYIASLFLPVNSPVILDDLATIFSSPSNEEDAGNTSGRQVHAEMVAPNSSCAFCCRILEWEQKMEKKGHRRISCGKFSIVLHEKPPHWNSTLRPSFWSDSGTGLQSDKCKDCGTKIPDFRRVCSKEPLTEFYYRYNTPGQKYLNHSRRGAFVQPHSLDANKNSSPSCSKQKRIGSQRMNSKSSPDECEPTPRKISGSKSLCDFSKEETESKILNSALDHALKTATILKKTTDQMIKAIAEDLAKAQRWRNRLKF